MKLTKAKRNRLIYTAVTFALVIGAFLILQSMIANKTITRSLKGQLVPICCWIVMAVSLNLVIGVSGELSLGHAGFMAVGAYAGAIFMKSTPAATLLRAGNHAAVIPYVICAVLISALVAGIFGLLIGIPALRLKGDYLAPHCT